MEQPVLTEQPVAIEQPGATEQPVLIEQPAATEQPLLIVQPTTGAAQPQPFLPPKPGTSRAATITVCNIFVRLLAGARITVRRTTIPIAANTGNWVVRAGPAFRRRSARGGSHGRTATSPPLPGHFAVSEGHAVIGKVFLDTASCAMEV
jgi:hypothetical protein